MVALPRVAGIAPDVIADRVLMYPPSDVVANDSPWRFVQWFEPDSNCTPLPPLVTYPAVDASCGENCRLIVNSSPRSGDNFFEQDGYVYANLATVFRFDPRANMATATWRGFIREESRLYCDHAPDSALFFSIQRVAQDQFIMSCAGSNSNRIMTVTPQQVCLTARVGSLAEGPGSNGAPDMVRKVRGAYVWLQQVQTFKQNVIILDEGAPAPRFLTDECGCTNYMAVHQDRIAYVRDEMGGTQLWIADPPYREARRVWTAAG